MSGGVEGVALQEALMAWEPEDDDRVRPLLLAEAGRRDAAEYSFTDANHVIAFLLHRLDASLTTPPARSYADGVEDAAKVADDYEQHTGDPAFDAATDVAAVTIGERIRLLSPGGKA